MCLFPLGFDISLNQPGSKLFENESSEIMTVINKVGYDNVNFCC